MSSPTIMPASVKTSVLPMYSMMCQTCSMDSRLHTSGGAYLASTTAAITVASTPLTFATSSATKNVR